MRDFFQFLESHWPEIVAGFSALGSWIITFVQIKRANSAKAALLAAQSRETQVECPKCHKKSPLSETHFYLPDGSKDDDLNGLPD